MSGTVRRYAIVEAGKVENVALWDGVTPWNPGEGTEVAPVTWAKKLGDSMTKVEAQLAREGKLLDERPAPVFDSPDRAK